MKKTTERGFSIITFILSLMSLILYQPTGKEIGIYVGGAMPGWELGEWGTHILFTGSVILGFIASIFSLISIDTHLSRLKAFIIGLYGFLLVTSFASYLHAYFLGTARSHIAFGILVKTPKDFLLPYAICATIGIILIISAIILTKDKSETIPEIVNKSDS